MSVATVLTCDGCKAQRELNAAENDAPPEDWGVLVPKRGSPGAASVRMDLCPRCIRRTLATLSTEERPR